MKIHQILQMMQGIRNANQSRERLMNSYNQPERSKREDSLTKWQIPKEECFHNYAENTDSYRYYSKRGCRCKRDAVL